MDVSPTIPEDGATVDELFVPPAMNAKGSLKKVETFEDILTRDGSCLRNVCINADPGMGKSSFCKKLLSVWCKSVSKRKTYNELGQSSRSDIDSCGLNEEQVQTPSSDEDVRNEEFMKRFHYLFFVLLRHTTSGEIYIEDMIKTQLLDSRFAETFEEVMTKEKDKCLVIVDGLDEWPETREKSPKQSKGFPKCKHSCCTLYTTRPWKLTECPPKFGELDEEIRLTGVREPKLLAGIVLNKLNRCHDRNDSVEDFIKDIDAKKLGGLMETPVMLKLLVCLWFDNRTLSLTKSMVFCDMIELLLRLYLTKHDKVVKSSNRCSIQLPKCLRGRPSCLMFAPMLSDLFRFSYKTLTKTQSLVFNESRLSDFGMKQSDIGVSLKAGLMSKTSIRKSSIDKHVQVSYMHRTFQEFFTALFLCQYPDKLTKILQKCNKLSHFLKHQSLLHFLSGIDESAVETIAEFMFGLPSIHSDTVSQTINSFIKESNISTEGRIPLKDLTFTHCKEFSQTNTLHTSRYFNPRRVKSLVIKDITLQNLSPLLQMDTLEEIKIMNVHCDDVMLFIEQLIELCRKCCNSIKVLTVDQSLGEGLVLTDTQMSQILCDITTLTHLKLCNVVCKSGPGTRTRSASHEAGSTIDRLQVSKKTTNLKNLVLYECSDVMCHVGSAPNLEHFVYYSEDCDRKVETGIFDVLSTSTNLMYVHITGVDIFDESISLYGGMNHLQTIILSEVTLYGRALLSALQNVSGANRAVCIQLNSVRINHDETSRVSLRDVWKFDVDADKICRNILVNENR